MKMEAAAPSRGPTIQLTMSFVSASSPVHVHMSPKPKMPRRSLGTFFCFA
jgi:hypothetical protein